MPKNINTEHVNRMFPFEFYDELNHLLVGYTLMNPAFFLQGHIRMDDTKKRDLFESDRNKPEKQTMNQNNILSVEPIGELLMLDTCCTNDQKEAILNGGLQRSQVPISILTVQLYDSSDQPVFSADVSEETIARIPEILWDDPNLLIAIVLFGEEGASVGILKAPLHIKQHIESRVFDNVDPTEIQNKEEWPNV